MAVRIPTDPLGKRNFNAWIRAANGPKPGTPQWIQGLNPQQTQDWRAWTSRVAGHTPAPQLGAQELASFQDRRRAANNTYLEGRTNLDLQRGQARRGFGDQVRDWRQNTTEQRQAMPGQYAQRGLLTSGIYRGALGDQSRQSLEAYSRILRDRNAAMGGFDLQLGGLERARAGQLQDIESQKRARLMELALQLHGIGGQR